MVFDSGLSIGGGRGRGPFIIIHGRWNHGMGNGVGGGCRHGHVHGPRAILLFLLSSKIYALFVVFKKIMHYVTLRFQIMLTGSLTLSHAAHWAS